jgi:hypothetical protein
MADGSWKRVELIQVGDLVESVFGPVPIDELYITTLGPRKMMTFNDKSLYWSEEHPFWAEKDGKEWWWAANVDIWKDEVKRGIIVGLKDNDSMMTGPGYRFATLNGWEAKTPEISPFWAPETPLYQPRAAGAPIIINNYVVTSGTNEFKFDYTKINWSKEFVRLRPNQEF